MTTPTADELAAMCGITRKAAINRLAKYQRGAINRAALLRPYTAPEWRSEGTPCGNAEWQALGDTPHNERLAAIPGCTAIERRVYGLADSEPPAAAPPKKPLSKQVAEAAGINIKSARDRIARLRAGKISMRDLWEPPRLEESRREIDAVVDRVGCCRNTASSRLRRYRLGLITEAKLYAPTTGGRK